MNNNFLLILLTGADASMTIPEQPLQMMEKYGLSFVLIVVMFMILIFLGKFIIKQFNGKNELIEKKDKLIEKKAAEILKMTKEVILLNKKIEDHMVDNNHQLSGEELKKNSQNTKKVYQILTHIKGKYDFDRVDMYQYHNGGKNINGIDFKKCSATHEICDLGIDSILDRHQSRHISSSYLWSQLIYNGGELIFPDVENIKSSDTLYEHTLKELGVKSYYSLAVFDYNDKPIGFVVMSLFNEVLKLDEKELNHIKSKLISLGSFIDAQEH